MLNAILPLLIAFTHRESQQQPLAQQSVPPTDLAFGLAQELDSEKLHNFVVTFQEHAPPSARLILVAFSEEGKPDVSPYRITGRAAVQVLCVARNASLAVSNQRFGAYLQVFRGVTAGGQPRRLLNADVGDIFFQGNPFAMAGDDDVIVTGQENVNMPVGKCTWMRNEKVCHPEQVSVDFMERRIICSGFAVGSTSAMLAYWTAMSNELAKCSSHLNGQDQGAHIYLIDHARPLDLIDRVRVEPMESGQIATLGLARTDLFEVCTSSDHAGCFDSSSGAYTNAIGIHPAVVHQYNRNDTMLMAVTNSCQRKQPRTAPRRFANLGCLQGRC